MKHIKLFKDYNNNIINEEFMFPLVPLAIFFLLWWNQRYSSFGLEYTETSVVTNQKFPFIGIFKYFKMSKIIKKYFKEIKKINKNILDKNPKLDYYLKKLTKKNTITTSYVTSPVLHGRWLIKNILDYCTEEDKEIIKKISEEFNIEMIELFYDEKKDFNRIN